jgi:hypothetical protein
VAATLKTPEDFFREAGAQEHSRVVEEERPQTPAQKEEAGRAHPSNDEEAVRARLLSAPDPLLCLHWCRPAAFFSVQYSGSDVLRSKCNTEMVHCN